MARETVFRGKNYAATIPSSVLNGAREQFTTKAKFPQQSDLRECYSMQRSTGNVLLHFKATQVIWEFLFATTLASYLVSKHKKKR